MPSGAAPVHGLAALRLGAAALALAIYLVDRGTTLAGAVAVLHVLVVLLAARTLRQADLVAAAVGCSALTAVAYVEMHGLAHVGEPTLRALVSLAAIGITALLALQNQAATRRLGAQARLLDLSHDMVFVRDTGGLIRYWNRAAAEVYGWTAAEALGRDADRLLQTRYPVERPLIDAALAGTGRWEGVLRQRTRAGAELVVESRFALRRDAAGRAAGVLETHIDVSERKAAQDALQLAHAELAHATRVATVGQLSASITHEVNQPLMAIVTNAEAGLRWLRRDPPDLDEAATAIGRIAAQGQRASDIVKRIGGYLRHAPPAPARLALAPLIEDATRLVQHELARGGVRLDLQVDAGLPPVRGERVALQQVIVNLVINAAQALAGQPEPRRIRLQAARLDAATLQLRVADNGPGISEAQLGQVFDPFFTTKAQGMGMGLAICRTIAEAHGGSLTVESCPGHGAEFRLCLPVADPEDPA